MTTIRNYLSKLKMQHEFERFTSSALAIIDQVWAGEKELGNYKSKRELAQKMLGDMTKIVLDEVEE